MGAGQTTGTKFGGRAEDRRSIWGRDRGQALNLAAGQRTGAQFGGGAKDGARLETFVKTNIDWEFPTWRTFIIKQKAQPSNKNTARR